MSDIKRVRGFKQEFIKNKPEIKEQVEELFQLMLDEIEEGNSVENECNMFIIACEQILEYNN